METPNQHRAPLRGREPLALRATRPAPRSPGAASGPEASPRAPSPGSAGESPGRQSESFLEDDTPKLIRVIEVRRHLTDPATAGQEELALILAAAREVPALAAAGETLRAFLDLARTLQGPLAPLLTWPAPPSQGAQTPGGETLDAILVRDLFANPAVRPIIVARGAAADTEREGEAADRIRTRAATRVRALDPEGYDIAIAGEEPVDVAGFAVDPLAAGKAVLDALGSGAFLGADVYAASGAYPAAVAAATGPVRPPEYPGEPGGEGAESAESASASAEADFAAIRRRGFAVVVIRSPTAEAPEALLRQARAAVSFYLSGAAAAGVFLRLAAAVRGDPGALPDLLAAVGPLEGVLAEDGGLVVGPARTGAAGLAGPTWRSPDDEARLRYLIGRLARTEPIAAADPGTWAFDLNPLNALFRVGAFGVYLYALTEGRESRRLDDFLELLAIRHARAVRLGEIARSARLYVSIIEDKFGASRVAAVLDALRTATGSRARGAPGGSLALPSDAVQVNDPDAVLALLTAREREVVEVEYENRRQEWEASVGNKCPHVRIARRLRAAASAEEALTALRELEKYLIEGPPRKGATAVSDAAGRDPRRAPPAPETQWLRCRNCGFRAICPHVRDRVRLDAARAPYDQVRTRLLRYAVRVPQKGEADSYTYYCRICSERLAEIIEEDRVAEQLGRFGDLDAGLRTKIWTVALGAARNVRFPTPTDERQFASAAAVVIYPLLMAAEEAVAKKGRRRRAPRAAPSPGGVDAEEEVDPRTQLYIVLFVYAYVLDLIRQSGAQGGRGAAHQEIGFVGVKLGVKESAVADRMLRLIAEEHRGLLSQIEDVTAEYLKARFIEAYRLVRREADGGLAAANPEEELAVQTTTIDPIYRYAAAVARVAGDLPTARPASPAEARREFEAVLGATLPAIIKQARESAKDPALAPLYLRRTGVEVPPGGALEFLIQDPRVNLYARLYKPKADVAGAEALKAFRAVAAAADLPAPGIRYWLGAGEGWRLGGRSKPRHGRDRDRDRDRDHGRPNGRDRKPEEGKPRGAARRGALVARPEDSLAAAERGCYFEAYRLFAIYSTAITSQTAYEAFRAELATFRRSEDGLRVSRALASLKPYYDFGWVHTQQYVPVDVPITTVYDENGIAHDWSKNVIYFYTASAGKAKPKGGPEPKGEGEGEGELVIKGGPAAVKKARESGELTLAMELVDLECPICHTRASRVGELDADKAWRSLRAASEIDSFYVFYESRCPEGELHDYEKGALGAGGRTRCRKCGLDAAVIKEATGGRAAKNKEAREYYDKYGARFAQERREARERIVAAEPRQRPSEAGLDGLEQAQAWRPDYTLVVRAAELADVTPATVEAIGSMEGGYPGPGSSLSSSQWPPGREYADIAEGRGVLPPPTSRSDPRILAADAEVRTFLNDYSILRNFARIRKPPPATAELLTAAGVPKHEYAALPDALPDVGAGYHGLFAAILRHRPAADAQAFAIQSLCRMTLEVAGLKTGPEWVGRLGPAFAKQELQTILRGQKLLSKPGSFNWAIFETGDDIVPDQVGDIGEDVLEELLGADEEEAPEDPFSGENMDYDTSEGNPNNEPE
jgi:hypothetical protein